MAVTANFDFASLASSGRCGADRNGRNSLAPGKRALTPTTTADPVRRDSTRLLGLDGLRGLAVAAVVVFHLWPSTAPAGFLGVSVFFTLSGFLITRLLLSEIDRSGTVSLRRFWGRRIRRLLPASLMTLLVIAIVWTATGWFTRDSARDTVAASFQMANWRRVAIDAQYGVTNETSPVLHFWSLAIEEQYYLALPLLVWLLRRHRALLAVVFVAITAGALAYVHANRGDAVLTYYSTFARLPELVLGALLATAVHGRVIGRRTQLAAGAAGALAVATLTFLVVTTSLATTSYYEGGLAGVGFVSSVAVAGAAFSPRFGGALALGPLVWLGRVSYGVYLFHWPLLIGLREAGASATVAPWLTLAITLAAAHASLRWFEDPIRERRLRRPQVQWAAVPAAGAALTLALIATATAPGPIIDFQAAVAQAEKMADAPHILATPDVGSAASAGATEPQVLRYAVFGDSTALTLGVGLGTTSLVAADVHLLPTAGDARLGCPIGRGGQIRGQARDSDRPGATDFPAEPECDWHHWADVVAASQGVDIALVHTGNWDVVGRRIPELGNRWVNIGEPAYDEWLYGEMLGATDALHAAGAGRVVWATIAADWTGDPHDERFDAFNRMVNRLAAERDFVSVVDLGGWLRSSGEDERLRPDGIHLSPDAGGTAAEVGDRWLARALVQAREGTSYVGP